MVESESNETVLLCEKRCTATYCLVMCATFCLATHATFCLRFFSPHRSIGQVNRISAHSVLRKNGLWVHIVSADLIAALVASQTARRRQKQMTSKRPTQPLKARNRGSGRRPTRETRRSVEKPTRLLSRSKPRRQPHGSRREANRNSSGCLPTGGQARPSRALSQTTCSITREATPVSKRSNGTRPRSVSLRIFLEQERSITLVGEVDAPDINAWFAHMRKTPGSRGQPRSERTIQTYARSARAFFHRPGAPGDD